MYTVKALMFIPPLAFGVVVRHFQVEKFYSIQCYVANLVHLVTVRDTITLPASPPDLLCCADLY